jgi:hypothetical protein
MVEQQKLYKLLSDSVHNWYDDENPDEIDSITQISVLRCENDEKLHQLFNWFFLLKSGYDCKIGYNEDNIYVLLPIKNNLYGIAYIEIDICIVIWRVDVGIVLTVAEHHFYRVRFQVSVSGLYESAYVFGIHLATLHAGVLHGKRFGTSADTPAEIDTGGTIQIKRKQQSE